MRPISILIALVIFVVPFSYGSELNLVIHNGSLVKIACENIQVVGNQLSADIYIDNKVPRFCDVSFISSSNVEFYGQNWLVLEPREDNRKIGFAVFTNNPTKTSIEFHVDRSSAHIKILSLVDIVTGTTLGIRIGQDSIPDFAGKILELSGLKFLGTLTPVISKLTALQENPNLRNNIEFQNQLAQILVEAEKQKPEISKRLVELGFSSRDIGHVFRELDRVSQNTSDAFDLIERAQTAEDYLTRIPTESEIISVELAERPTFSPGTQVTTTTGLNLRYAPGIIDSRNISKVLPRGAKGTILEDTISQKDMNGHTFGTSHEWFYVDFPGYGKGWVAGSFLDTIKVDSPPYPGKVYAVIADQPDPSPEKEPLPSIGSLAVYPDSLDFGAEDTERTFQISVERVHIWTHQSDWIGYHINPYDRIVTVKIDRSSLSPGEHQSELNVEYNGQKTQVQIMLEVPGPKERETSGPVIKVPYDRRSIRDAIDVAQDGYTVLVYNGTYTGNLNFWGKKIIVMSAFGPENCIIDCQHNGMGFWFRSGEGPNSIVDGFTIINGNESGGGAGIRCGESSPTIRNMVLKNNRTPDEGGAIYLHKSSPVIENCQIINNRARTRGGAMYLKSSHPKITNVTMVDNYASYGSGIFLTERSYPTISYSVLWNKGNQEISRQDDSEPEISYSVIKGGYAGEGNTAEILSAPAITKPQLLQNYPNPFNPETWIPFRVNAEARLVIYNQQGRLIRSFNLFPSQNQIHWDGKNKNGEQVAAGIYFYSLQANHFEHTRKMVITK